MVIGFNVWPLNPPRKSSLNPLDRRLCTTMAKKNIPTCAGIETSHPVTLQIELSRLLKCLLCWQSESSFLRGRWQIWLWRQEEPSGAATAGFSRAPREISELRLWQPPVQLVIRKRNWRTDWACDLTRWRHHYSGAEFGICEEHLGGSQRQ